MGTSLEDHAFRIYVTEMALSSFVVQGRALTVARETYTQRANSLCYCGEAYHAVILTMTMMMFFPGSFVFGLGCYSGQTHTLPLIYSQRRLTATQW